MSTRPQFLEAERFVVTLEAAGERRKLFGVQFEKRPTGLGYYVHLPYFRYSQGLLGGGWLTGPVGTQAHVNLGATGTTTSKHIKYAHHADGHAHFSQDGQVRTEVRNQTPRLRESRGHVFSLQFWGADAFSLASAKDQKPPTARRACVGFELMDQSQPAASVAGAVIGWWYPRRLIHLSHTGSEQPDFARPIAWDLIDGTRRSALIIAPPSAPAADDFTLILTYRPLPPRDIDNAPQLVFIGAFDAPGDPQSADARATFLSLMYGDHTADFDDLKHRLGSIDLQEARPHILDESQ